jgi:hypothetical protein
MDMLRDSDFDLAGLVASVGGETVQGTHPALLHPHGLR